MAGVKTTNRGVYSILERALDMLTSMADIILDVGEDQAKWPTKLPSGELDMEDTTKEQYEEFERSKVRRKRERENSVNELAISGKKRLAKKEQEEDDEDVGYNQEDDEDVSIEDGEVAKDKDEIDEEAVVDDHFAKSKKPSYQGKRKGAIKSLAKQEQSDDVVWLQTLMSSNSSSSRRPLAEEIELQNNAARLEREKEAAQEERSMRMFSLLLANK